MATFWMLDSYGCEGRLYANNPWDTATLGGYQLPGLVKVRATPEVQVDRQKVHGSNKTALVLNGYLPGSIDVEVKVWTPEQWDVLSEAIDNLWRKRERKLAEVETGGTRPKTKAEAAAQENAVAASQTAKAGAATQASVSLLWPGLNAYGVKAVIIAGVSLPEDGPEPGTKVVRFKCIEYVPPNEAPSAKDLPRRSAGSKASKTTPLNVVAPFQRPTNSAPPQPSTTDTGPNGPPEKPAGGSS